MRRSTASFAGITIILLFQAFPTTSLFAQSSAQQTATVLVSPIVSLAVEPFVETADRTSLLYDLTTNVRGAILEAVVLSSSTPDVSVTLIASTNHGVSEGPVVLRPDGPPLPVVTTIQPGLENGQRISVTLDGKTPGDLSLALTLRDPVSGAFQTVVAEL